MSNQIINVGSSPNDGTGDALRNAFIKVNANFSSIDAILANVLTTSSTIPQSQVDGLVTALGNITSDLSGIGVDLNAINAAIFSINTALSSQNVSISDLYTQISDLQTQIYTKIGEAPLDGQQYARKNGTWTVITGGGGGGTGSYVPYTGATADVDLNTKNLTTDGNITARNFVINSTPYGEMLIGDNNTYQRISFNSIDTSNNYGLLNLVVNPEEGFVSTKTEISDNYTQINQSNNSILFKNYTSSGDILNTFSLDQTASVFTKVVNVNDGVQTGDVGGANYSQLGTNNGSYAGFYFKSTDSSNDDFGQCALTINPEEGFVSQFTKTGGFTSQLSHNSLGLTEYVGDGVVDNTFNINTTSTSSSKKITTGEGFEGNYVQFNTAATEANAVGKLKWNDTDGTLDLGLKGGNVNLQIGQEQVLRVVNKTATNITLLEANYQAVRVTGAQGNRLKVDLAQATNDLLSAETIGLVTETILNNEEGFITTNGLVRNINTTGSLQSETWLDGDMLYLSPTTAGQITNIKPSAPNHLVIIGYVVRAHITQGQIFVKVDNGYELDELHNVSITGATGGQVLTYDSVNGVWENQTLPTIASQIGYTPLRLLNVNTTPHTGTLSETIITTATILGGSFNTYDVMKVFLQTNKSLTTNNVTYRIKVNTSNTLSGAVQVATFTTTTTLSYTQIQRTFTLRDNLLVGYTFTGSAVNDFANTGGSLGSTTYNTTNSLYVFFTIQLGNIGDSATISLTNITN